MTQSIGKGTQLGKSVHEIGIADGRALLEKLHQLHGRVEDKRCRDCAAFTRSPKVYTAGRCRAAFNRNTYCWRGDWVACGLIEVAAEADAEIRGKKWAGRPPAIRMDMDGRVEIFQGGDDE